MSSRSKSVFNIKINSPSRNKKRRSSSSSSSSSRSKYKLSKNKNIKEKNIEDLIKEPDVSYKKIINEDNCYATEIDADPDRIIVLGDIHGDYKLMLNMLYIAKVIEKPDSNVMNFKFDAKSFTKDNDNDYPEIVTDSKIKYNYLYHKVFQYVKWTGGGTYVIQVGDQVDRCRPSGNMYCSNKNATYNDEASDELILLFMSYLDNLAKKNNGRVISLLGNHELMNALGDMTYVSKEGALEYSTNNTYENGIENRVEKFKPGSTIGTLLGCSRQSAVIIGNHLFVHGGVINSMLPYIDITGDVDSKTNRDKLREINLYIKKWLRTEELKTRQLEIVENLLKPASNKTSFFWNRVLGVLPPKVPSDDLTCLNHLTNVLKWFKINGVIIGHTPQSFTNSSDINETCGTGVWRVDNGSSNAFSVFDKQKKYTDYREPQVLEILKKDKDKYKYNILK